MVRQESRLRFQTAVVTAPKMGAVALRIDSSDAVSVCAA